MSLPDLHGYWKYADVVVPFRLPLAPVKIRARGYIAREIPPIEIKLPVRRQKSLSETHEGSDEQTSGRKATRDARTSGGRSRKKKSKRAAKGDKRDTRQHEHSITERENRLETALGGNVVEEASMEVLRQDMTPDSDTTMNSDSRPIALEIGEIDEELEHAQIVL